MNAPGYVCLTLFDGERCPLCGQPPEAHEDFATWQPPPVNDDYRDRRLTEFLL